MVARTGGEAVGAGDSGVVYFSLTRSGRKLLSRTRGHELAVSCYAKATVSAGREVIARTGTEFIGAEDSAVVFFKLTAAGKAMLAHARGNQLAVAITVTSRRHTASERGSLVRFG
ncbi:MAG: hypothetical protein WBP81_32905 [Solirubrobacteraceae bacterium]